MWLILIIKAYLGWAYSICRRLVHLAAPQIGVVVVATIVSQMSRLLAFFLPLKIIILIGSTGVPRYFPRAFQDYEREPLVIGLGVAAVGFYVLYLLAGKVVEIFTERSADRVTAHTAKLALFSNQDEIVRDACRKLAESIAAAIFGALAITLLAVIYPTVAIVIVSWTVGALLAVSFAGAVSTDFRAWLEEHPRDLVEAISALGLFAVTASIVIEFIAGAHFPILYAIVSILLTRQLLQRLGKTFTNALSLYPRRLFVNTLFLRSHIWTGNGKLERGSVWDLVGANPPRKWLPEVLLETTGEDIADVEMTRWHQTGIVDVLAFEARAQGGGDESYLVKLFGRKRHLAAMHEATLLGSFPARALPAPAFLGSAFAGDHHCHIFEKLGGEPLPKEEFKEARLDFMADCWQCRPPSDLVQRYKRSHQLLGRRLAAAELGRLRLAVNGPEEEAAVASLSHAIEKARLVLESMPLVILNPALRPERMVRLEDGRPITLNWEYWRLEPIGAGWPVDEEDLPQLGHWLDKARRHREDLATVTSEEAQLAALLLEMDKLLIRQRYRSVVEFLPSVMSCLEGILLMQARQI